MARRPAIICCSSALTFWPAILFVLPGIGLAVTRRAEPAIRFLLAWAAGWWLLVEAVPTKLPHYVLPAYPALAILAALWLLAPKTTNPQPAGGAGCPGLRRCNSCSAWRRCAPRRLLLPSFMAPAPARLAGRCWLAAGAGRAVVGLAGADPVR